MIVPTAREQNSTSDYAALRSGPSGAIVLVWNRSSPENISHENIKPRRLNWYFSARSWHFTRNRVVEAAEQLLSC
jgi:hypothetical protein